MYTGFTEILTPEGPVFYLQGAFGGEVQAAVGKPQPAPDGGVFHVYFGNHPAAAEPIMTQDKCELVAWLEAIIYGSNKTMQQAPAPAKPAPAPAPAAPAAAPDPQPSAAQLQPVAAPAPPPAATQPASAAAPTANGAAPPAAAKPSEPSKAPSKPPSPASESPPSHDDEAEAPKEGGGPSAPLPAASPAAAHPRSPHRGAAAPQQPQSRATPGFRFLSYREEVRGLTEHGDPPRRLRHWLLRDGLGREHVAVDTVAWHRGKKRFTYAAVEPFCKVRPLSCHNQRAVLLYLDQFVPLEARQAPPEDPAASPRPAAKATPQKASGGGPKAKPASESGPPAAVPPSPALIADPGRRAEVRAARVAAVAAELEALAAECGLQYSLTLVGDKGLQVLTSGAVAQQNAAPAAPLPPQAALPAPAPPAADSEGGAPRRDRKRPAPAPRPADIPGAEGDGAAPAQPREKRVRRGKTLSADPADDVAALVAGMVSNSKMYVSGRWYRDPLTPHPLEEMLEAFAVAADCGEGADAAALPARLALALPPDAEGAPGATAGAPTESDVLVVLDALPEPVAAADVAVQPVFGIDAFTRQLLTAALERCPETPGAASRAAFIDGLLLPALNALGEGGWDVVAALRTVERGAAGGAPGPATTAARVAAALEGLETHFAEGKEVKPGSRKHVRAHPKGEGVVVSREGGLPAGAFLGEYLGELVTSWRWAEREAARRGAAAGRRAATRMGASSDYLNIALERPAADSRGYDVLYVDAARRGNWVSRLGHSCAPNSRSVTVAVGGRLTVGVWTTRAVAPGEELTMDFAGETESEREAAAAVCLCGAAACRESFLYVNPAPGSPLNAVVDARMTPPDRLRLLLQAAARPAPAPADEARLAAHGFRELLLTDATGAPVPGWLRAWAAAALGFAEDEAAALRAGLPGTAAPGGGEYTAEEAAEDVEQLLGERRHSLATALDRAKLFLRHQQGEAAAAPPLVPLSDSQTAAYLWTAPESVARRAVAALAAHAEQRATAAAGIGKRALRQGRRSTVANLLPRWAGVPKAEAENGEEANMAPEANGVGPADPDTGGDAAELWALAERLSALIDATEAPTADAARAGLRQLAAELLAAGRPLHLAAHDILSLHAATRAYSAATEYRGFASALANGREGARYRPGFLLALLAGWPRASADEGDALSADRRGCLCLPDVESAYAAGLTEDGGRAYAAGDRAPLLRGLAFAPRAPWPRALCPWFTFRNTGKVYGSPQLDGALREGGDAAVAGLAEALLAASKD